MSGIYKNETGKFRSLTDTCVRESNERKKWFQVFEQTLRSRFPILLKGIRLQIVGSVAKNAAIATSDIDIVIHQENSSPLYVPQISQAISDLLSEMKKENEKVYSINIHSPKNELMFSEVAMYRKENGKIAS